MGREAWHEIPELNGVDERRAQICYARARARLWRDWRTWALAGAVVVLVAAYIVFVPSARAVLGVHWAWASLANGLLGGLIGGGVVRLFSTVTRPTLRRFVRGELGTHCAGCDYDLRATPDLPPPAVTRCPECGRRVPRNVHRRTIPAPSPDAPGRS
jgi:hypothetical protein